MPTDLLEASLPNLIPGLFKNFEHKESPVRKASCFCLVAIYLRVEEAMRPYMDTLNGHRVSLWLECPEESWAEDLEPINGQSLVGV